MVVAWQELMVSWVGGVVENSMLIRPVALPCTQVQTAELLCTAVAYRGGGAINIQLDMFVSACDCFCTAIRNNLEQNIHRSWLSVVLGEIRMGIGLSPVSWQWR